MKERPILLSAPMVQAILDGRKTQTRRVKGLDHVNTAWNRTAIEKADCRGGLWHFWDGHEGSSSFAAFVAKCPYGQPGDRLWVKETFRMWDHSIDAVEVEYSADGIFQYVEMEHRQKRELKGLHKRDNKGKKLTHPSIFMPRWASRITLEITAVRVERLQEISEDDAKAEGVSPSLPVADERWVNSYHLLWDSINAKTHPWRSNPFVWVISFRKV